MPAKAIAKTSSLPPVEILLQILSHLRENDHQTLLTTLHASRGLYAVAAHRIYQTIRFSSYNPKNPFFDAEPVTPPNQGGLAKRRVIIGKPSKSRKARLLDEVKVLDLDGRIDGPFWVNEEMNLPGLRTLRIDLSLTSMEGGDTQASKRWADLARIRPTTFIFKHLSFHKLTHLLDHLTPATLSSVSRYIYLIDYSALDPGFGRTHGPSNAIPDFGLIQWLESLQYCLSSRLKSVDIVFWTSGPGLNFSTPNNAYAYKKQQAGGTWLDLYIQHLSTCSILSRSTPIINFVNTGSFDRHSISADEWDYGEVEQAFKEKLIKGLQDQEEEEEDKDDVAVHTLTIPQWLESLRKGGVNRGDVLTDEEVRPWLA